jgi:hypothetical protein
MPKCGCKATKPENEKPASGEKKEIKTPKKKK